MVLLMKCTCIALLSTDHFDPAKCCLQQTDCMSLLFLFSLTCLWQSAQSLYTGRAFHIGIRKVRHARRLGQVHCLQPSLLDDTVAVDVSPEHNGSILKKLLRSGDESQRKPLMRDTVAIEWKIYRTDGSLVHDSSRPADASTCTQSSEVESNNKPSMMQNGTFEIEEEHFQFKLGATPRQVITGWEYAVKTMNPGELSLFTIAPEHAFGTMGAPPLIAPDSTLLCELELVNIIPSLTSKYKTVGYNESIRDELMEQIQSGQSPVAPAVTHTRSKKDQVTQAVRTSNVASAAVESTVTPSSDEGSVDRSDSRTGAINDNRGQTVGGEAPRAREEGMEAKFFDPDTHKLDSKLQVSGIGKGYMWTENRHTLDIEVPIRLADPGTIRKRDILIDIWWVVLHLLLVSCVLLSMLYDLLAASQTVL